MSVRWMAAWLVVLAGAWMTVAEAEPYFAVREGLKCASCHVNPSGGGMRNAFGITWAQTSLPAKRLEFPGGEPWTGTINRYIAVGGNLRAVFPQSRVVTPGYPVQVFGPPVPGPCLLVWEGDRKPAKDLRDYLAANYGVTIKDAVAQGDVNAPLLTSRDRRDTMNYILIQKGRCAGT